MLPDVNNAAALMIALTGMVSAVGAVSYLRGGREKPDPYATLMKAIVENSAAINSQGDIYRNNMVQFEKANTGIAALTASLTSLLAAILKNLDTMVEVQRQMQLENARQGRNMWGQ